MKRFENFPIHVEVLNRFVVESKQKEILRELKEGKVDMIIGTHRILSKDVQFHEDVYKRQVLISTHLISDIEKIFDDVIFLKYGELAMHENAEQLRAETGKSVDEVFREVFKC